MLDQRRQIATPGVDDVYDMNDFKASVVAYEVQKSFANKFFSNKSVVKSLIDDTSGKLLDNLYLMIKSFTKNKEESKKVVKNIIKISVKIGMLQRGEKFTNEEKDNLIKIQKNLRTIAMTLISFYQVDHTYDRGFIIKYLSDLEDLLKKLISPHLTDKSVGRVEQVFGVVKNADLLDSLYIPKKNEELRDIMSRLVEDMNTCMEAGVL